MMPSGQPRPGMNPAEQYFLWEEALTGGVLRRRIFSWIIDAALVGALSATAWHILVIFGILTLGFGFPLLGMLPAIPVLYTWIFTTSPMSATPGMALFGLRLVRNADLGPPDVVATLIWTICYYITMAVGVIWLGAALLTYRRRAIHDLLSGLVVVRMKALTPAAPSWNMGGGGFPPA